MYDGATTTVRSAAELTEEFKVGVGLHQSSTLSSFLFRHEQADEGHQEGCTMEYAVCR